MIITISLQITWGNNWKKSKGAIENLTIIIGDFHNSLSIVDRQKITKEIESLSNMIKQLILLGIYKTLDSTVTECMFFSSTHRT